MWLVHFILISVVPGDPISRNMSTCKWFLLYTPPLSFNLSMDLRWFTFQSFAFTSCEMGGQGNITSTTMMSLSFGLKDESNIVRRKCDFIKKQRLQVCSVNLNMTLLPVIEVCTHALVYSLISGGCFHFLRLECCTMILPVWNVYFLLTLPKSSSMTVTFWSGRGGYGTQKLLLWVLGSL